MKVRAVVVWFVVLLCLAVGAWAARLAGGDGKELPLRASDTVAILQPAANTGGTLTLPAGGAGNFHYIVSIQIRRHATAALAGTATLSITTTNLGGLAWRVGNLMSAGGTQRDVEMDIHNPLRSAAANTASTIVVPAPGAAVLWDVLCLYYVAP